MLLELWKYLNGYVCISITGFSRERFVNLLALNNIFAWDIVSSGKYINLKITVRGLKKIKPILKKTNCRFRIIAKYGYPFVSYKYRKRHFFILGFISFWMVIFALSQFIWLIEINGNVYVSDAEILDFCKKNAINIGSYKKKIDTNKLKESITKNYPQISWVSIVNKGTRLSINVAENVKNTEILDYSQPCDIISTRDCIITHIITQNGTPIVNVGNTVKKGDLLISGGFDIVDENGNPAPLSSVHANGQIRGKWHTYFDINVPYKHVTKQYTENRQNFYTVKVFNKKFDTNFIKNGTKFQKYDKIFKSKQLGFSPDFPLPVVIYRLTLYEYTEEYDFFSPEQAEEYAKTLINKKIVTDFSDSCEILEKKVDFIHSDNQLTAKVYILIDDYIGEQIAPQQGGNIINESTEGTN